MADVTVYGLPISNFVWAVRMALEEKGVAYDHEPTPPGDEVAKGLHPYGKIPALKHGDVVVFETEAIARYVDKVFDGPKLFPEDPVIAAQCDGWISAFNTGLEPVCIRRYGLAYLFPKGEDGKPDRAVIDAAVAEMPRFIDAADAALEDTGWFAGDDMSFADILMTPTLYYMQRFPESADMIGMKKNLVPFLEKMAKRESFVKSAPPMSQLP
ncbi:MAG: glutathione S-transferase family protein [Maricaulaceae bacterium]